MSVKVKVRQRGGFLGLDREILIEGDRVRITEKGATRARPIDSAVAARIRALATRVAGVSEQAVHRSSELPSDALATRIAIQDGKRRKQLTIRSGDAAPDEVWELIGVVDDSAVAD